MALRDRSCNVNLPVDGVQNSFGSYRQPKSKLPSDSGSDSSPAELRYCCGENDAENFEPLKLGVLHRQGQTSCRKGHFFEDITRHDHEHLSAVRRCAEQLRRRLQWSFDKTTGHFKKKRNNASEIDVSEATSLLHQLQLEKNTGTAKENNVQHNEDVNELITQVNTVRNAVSSCTTTRATDVVSCTSAPASEPPRRRPVLVSFALDEQHGVWSVVTGPCGDVAQSSTGAKEQREVSESPVHRPNAGRETLRKRLLKANHDAASAPAPCANDANNNEDATPPPPRVRMQSLTASSSSDNDSQRSGSSDRVIAEKIRRFVRQKLRHV